LPIELLVGCQGDTMKTLSELTSRTITPTNTHRREEKAEILTSRMEMGSRTARPAVYEVEVFNFLFDNKAALGIQSVIKFTNLVVDGQVILTNGRRWVVEVKLRMNWLRQCQAEWQFRHFLRTEEAKSNPVDGAIVFFEEFSGEGGRKAKKAKHLWGWEGWYLYSWHSIDGKQMHLLKLCNGKLHGYPG
jgi:hypothetical protein